MLWEEGTANELVGGERSSSNSVLTASSCGGLLEGGARSTWDFIAGGVSITILAYTNLSCTRKQIPSMGAALLENQHQNPGENHTASSPIEVSRGPGR